MYLLRVVTIDKLALNHLSESSGLLIEPTIVIFAT
jgi:hypothetical protein